MLVKTPVLARNTEPGPLVMSSDPKGSDFTEWAGANDPNGNDVQPVPEGLLGHVQFMRCVQRGILVIENEEDNPEVVATLAKQNAAWAARRAQAQQNAEASIDHQANNDLIAVQCVGPGARGSQCDNTISVKEKVANDKPPLCPTHADLAPQYTPYDDVTGEKTQRKWNRLVMGERERQQQ